MAGWAPSTYTLTGLDQPQQIYGARVTADFFTVLGAKPVLGRTFLPGEDLPSRVAAALAVKECGFVPVSHLSARRLSSREDLTGFLGALKDRVGIERAFVVAGDPPQPLGPFDDALAVIQRGDLSDYGIKRVGISGYPEGHPDISQAQLWDALRAKHKALVEGGYAAEIVTQFGFDSEAVLHWLERLRHEANIHVKVRIGLPGPASVKTLLRFATRCGVAAVAGEGNQLAVGRNTASTHSFRGQWPGFTAVNVLNKTTRQVPSFVA